MKKVIVAIGIIVIVLSIFIVVKFRNHAKPVDKGIYVIENVHIITGDGKEEFNKNVFIQDKKVVKISEDKISEKSAVVIDGTGKTLMPGLIDSHCHIQGTTCKSEEESDIFLKNRVPEIFQGLLKSGVTTIKELGAPEEFIFKLKDKMNRGEITGPNLLIVGPNITAKGGHPAVTLGGDNPWIRDQMAEEIEDEQQARATVRRLAEKHVDFIKIVYQGSQYYYFDKELVLNKLDINIVKAIIEEAKKYNLKVTAHVQSEEDVLDLLNVGIYGLEHGDLSRDIQDGDKIMEVWKNKGVYLVPTIQILSGEHDKNVIKHGMYNLKKLYDYGVKVALGTDNMLELLPGSVVHTELQYYVQAGLTEMEALVTATHNSAEYLGILDKTGTVEEGKNADLILLDKNPLEDIQYINQINSVFKDGYIVYSKENNQRIELSDYTFPSDEALRYSDNTLTLSDNEVEKIYTMKEFNESGIIDLECQDQGNSLQQEQFKTKKNLETEEWSLKKSSTGTDMKAVVAGDTITLTGTFENKPVEKIYQLDSLPWMQMGMLNYGSFIKSKYEKISYYAIGTSGRGALNLVKFDAKKEGNETIEVDGKKYDCIKIATVLSEYSFVWTGYSWHDKDTGVLIKYANKGKEENTLHIME